MLNETTIRLLEARGIDPEIAVKLGVDTHARDGGDDWIAIPYVFGGRVVNHKYRSRIHSRTFKRTFQ